MYGVFGPEKNFSQTINSRVNEYINLAEKAFESSC